MGEIKTILFAIDLKDDNTHFIQRAKTLLETLTVSVLFLHVVELMPEHSVGYMMTPDIQEKRTIEAQQVLNKLLKEFTYSLDSLLIEKGSPKQLIVQVATKIHADLIILGNHGHHGIGLLLGSTVSSVLHHAPCDVWIIKSSVYPYF